MKWPSYPGDHTRTYGTKKRTLTWQHLTLCSFWIAHGMLHSEDETFVTIVRMQMQDREMPTRGQYRRLEWLATYAHRVYEQPVFNGETTMDEATTRKMLEQWRNGVGKNVARAWREATA